MVLNQTYDWLLIKTVVFKIVRVNKKIYIVIIHANFALLAVGNVESFAGSCCIFCVFVYGQNIKIENIKTYSCNS